MDLGDGPITVQAFQNGNDYFEAALPVDQTIVFRKLEQIIQFPDIPDIVVGEDQLHAQSVRMLASAPVTQRAEISLSATASSGLPVSFSIISGPAFVHGNTVTATATGTIVVRAAQNGDHIFNYAAAEASFTVTFPRPPKTPQTITFNLPSSLLVDGPPFLLQGVASSGLPLTYSIVSGPAIISNGAVVPEGAGSVVIEATQAGNEDFEPAPAVQRTALLLATPRISLEFSHSNLSIRWPGHDLFLLESSTSPNGPWTTVSIPLGAPAGEFLAPIDPLTEMAFFRLKSLTLPQSDHSGLTLEQNVATDP